MEDNLGQKIQKVRKLKGYSQDYMAAKLQVSQRAYSKLENNETKMSWDRLAQVSKVLEIEPIELVSFDDSLIFHNCSQSGKLHIFNNFPEALRQQYDKQIAHLEEEVRFLRGQLDSKTLKSKSG